MTVTAAAGNYSVEGRGSDLRILVSGRDLGACLRAAVRGLADYMADSTHAPRRRDAIALEGDDPAALLHSLVDEAIERMDTDGELAVELADLRVEAGRLEGTFELVALAALEVHGVAPKAATWHELRLEEGPDGWHGQVTLDL